MITAERAKKAMEEKKKADLQMKNLVSKTFKTDTKRVGMSKGTLKAYKIPKFNAEEIKGIAFKR